MDTLLKSNNNIIAQNLPDRAFMWVKAIWICFNVYHDTNLVKQHKNIISLRVVRYLV